MDVYEALCKTTVPFGKYKHTPLSGVPVKYLKYLLTQDWVERQFTGLYKAVRSYLTEPERRFKLSQKATR